MDISRKRKGIAGAFSLSALNQLVCSGTNFLLGAYLVRTLSPADYGVFGIGIAICLFYGGLGNSLFLTQMVVNTPDKMESERDLFAANTLINMVIFSCVVAILATIVFWCSCIFNKEFFKLSSCFFSMTSISIAYSIKEFFVRHAYNILKESWALYIHTVLAISLFGILAIIIALNYAITVVTILWSYSFAHLCAVLVGCQLARLPVFKASAKQLWEEACLSWSGGRWTVISSIVYFVRTQAHIIIATALLGPIGVAKLNATRLLVTPPVTLIPALGQVFFPRLARQAASESATIYRTVSLFAGLLLGISVIYSISLILTLDYVEKIILSGKYKSIQFLAVSWCFYICVFSVRNSIDMTVQVMKCFREQMNAYIVSAILTLISSFLLVKYFHQDSYVMGMIIGELAVGALLYKVIANGYPFIGKKLADNA